MWCVVVGGGGNEKENRGEERDGRWGRCSLGKGTGRKERDDGVDGGVLGQNGLLSKLNIKIGLHTKLLFKISSSIHISRDNIFLCYFIYFLICFPSCGWLSPKFLFKPQPHQWATVRDIFEVAKLRLVLSLCMKKNFGLQVVFHT